VVICLERGADLHMAQLMPLPLTVSCFSKIKILPFWYQLTRVVPDTGPLNGCVWIDCLSVDTDNQLPVLSTSAGLTTDAAKDVREPASCYYAGNTGQDTD